MKIRTVAIIALACTCFSTAVRADQRSGVGVTSDVGASAGSKGSGYKYSPFDFTDSEGTAKSAGGAKGSASIEGDGFFFDASSDSTTNDITATASAHNATIQLTDAAGLTPLFSGLFSSSHGVLKTKTIEFVAHFLLTIHHAVSKAATGGTAMTHLSITSGANRDFLDIVGDPDNKRGRFTPRGAPVDISKTSTKASGNFDKTIAVGVPVDISSKDIDQGALNLFFNVSLSESTTKSAVGSASLKLDTSSDAFTFTPSGGKSTSLDFAGINAQPLPVSPNVPEAGTTALLLVGGATLAAYFGVRRVYAGALHA